jgi:hypothetical protein
MTGFGISGICDTAHVTCVRSMYVYNLPHAILFTIELYTYSGEISLLALLAVDNVCKVRCFNVEWH